MVTDRFGALLEELGELMNTKLTPSANNSCRILLPDNISLTIEPDVMGVLLDIVVEISPPGEGKYRENILREALRCNGTIKPRIGTFCYGQKTNNLLLYQSVELEDLTATRLFEINEQLLEKARYWKEAIERGEIPALQGSNGHHEGIFGL